MKFCFLLLALSLMFWGCTGEESLGVDTQAPNKPELVPHLGDTGDIIQNYQGNSDTLNFYNIYSDINFENNGIDAMMEGDWLKIQWFRLEDSDIDYLKIFRFSAQEYYNAIDTLNFAQIIDTVNYEDQIYYVDKTSTTDKNYFYFIEAIDNAGNSTLSDTTGYKLIDKPYLISPADYYSCESNDIYDIVFEWEQVGDVFYFRLLVFSEDRELIWQQTMLDTGSFNVQYDGPPVDPGSVLIWRIDAFGSTYSTPNPIEGNYYIVESGAESVERTLSIHR